MPHRCYRREGGVAEALTGGAEARDDGDLAVGVGVRVVASS